MDCTQRHALTLIQKGIARRSSIKLWMQYWFTAYWSKAGEFRLQKLAQQQIWVQIKSIKHTNGSTQPSHVLGIWHFSWIKGQLPWTNSHESWHYQLYITHVQYMNRKWPLSSRIWLDGYPFFRTYVEKVIRRSSITSTTSTGGVHSCIELFTSPKREPEP